MQNFLSKTCFCTCQEIRLEFGNSVIEGAVDAVLTNPVSPRSKMGHIFDFWCQNGAKIWIERNGAKNVVCQNFKIFSKNHWTSKLFLAPLNWRHLFFNIIIVKYGISPFTGKKNYCRKCFRRYFSVKRNCIWNRVFSSKSASNWKKHEKCIFWSFSRPP